MGVRRVSIKGTTLQPAEIIFSLKQPDYFFLKDRKTNIAGTD